MHRNRILTFTVLTVGLAASAFGRSALEIETGTPYHTALRPATNLTARIDLGTDAPARWKGQIAFRDYFGRTFTVPVSGWGAKGTSLRVKLPEPPAMGLWRGCAELVSDKGEKAVCQANFAVLDPHPVTPLAPRDSFRIGINYHSTWYDPELRHKTTDALVALGAKMMRGDLGAMSTIETSKNVFDWTKTDTIVNELLSHGIAIDAIISTVPKWARHPDYASVSNGPTWVVPMRPGLAAAYGKALAGRYGTKIEYYEIGNELDVVPASHLTVEQAMARQREFYGAIKSVCPQAKVIPCGWALADSSSWMVKQKGFQERFMREAQDVCDFHPVHIHATYDNFRREALKFFAWRKRDGVTLPWYANETAASTCAGQEDSAAMWVWQKPLWAWAHGSVDYIWYNLRATGPDPNNGEHAYGLFTMDLQPRATAAAFSALTAVFNGLSFNRILRDTEACQIYLFDAKEAGKVVTGWDAFAATPRTITFATDALSCERVDMMGNRTSVTVKDGRAVLALGRLPAAFVFARATKAEPKAAELAADSVRRFVDVRIVAARKPPIAPALVFDSMNRYHGLCDGNAETEHRLWKGPQDLSAKAWFWKPDGETVHARVVVRDDTPVPFRNGEKPTGDHIRFSFNGHEERLAPKKIENGEAVYEFDLAWHAVPGPLLLEVYDDDGEGLDGSLGGSDLLLRY